ncbi:MAG TPA: hypothetical protein VIY47_12540 [Ignavibacteriaceae bacterium]
MNNDETIIKYIENELTSEERFAFEIDLRNSAQLRRDYEYILNVKNEIIDLKKVKLNQNYLDSIVPEFRNKFGTPETTNVKRYLGYAFATMLSFILAAVILQKIFTEKTDVNEVKQFAESLNENQKIELLENLNGSLEDYYPLSDQSAEIELTSLMQTDLKINYEVAEAYDISYPELVEGLSPSEAEQIYNEILNKNFSEEVNL